jgi:cytochrome b involved in lipid metabolism
VLQGRRRHKGNKQLATSSPKGATAIETHPSKYNRGPAKRAAGGSRGGGTLVEVKSNCKISHRFSSVPTPPADWPQRVLPMSEIAKHNRADDCWLVVKGRVYDVTAMVAQHPGSGRAILRHAGQVCDEDFEFHSKAARNFWKKHYCIGYVKGSEPQPFLSSCHVM